jgi:hypothetical protein
VLTRLLVGAGCLLAGAEMWRLLHRALAPGTITLPLAGYPTLPPAAVPWLIGAWIGCALAFTVGWYRRTSGVLLLMVMAYLLLMDERTYSNHLYLLCLLVLILTWADDLTARTLLRAQLSIVYGYAVLTKINLSFLSGAALLQYTRTVLPESWIRFEVLAPFALATLVAEAFLGVAFWSERLRPWAWGVGLALHVGAVGLVQQGRIGVLIFGIAMIALYTAFGMPLGDPGHPSPATPAPATRTPIG